MEEFIDHILAFELLGGEFGQLVLREEMPPVWRVRLSLEVAVAVGDGVGQEVVVGEGAGGEFAGGLEGGPVRQGG